LCGDYGAPEGAIVFTILTIIDVQHGAPAGLNNELIYRGSLVGIVFGSIGGGVIGLTVALC